MLCRKQELTILLRESYDLVFGKLPRKTQEALLQKSRPALNESQRAAAAIAEDPDRPALWI